MEAIKVLLGLGDPLVGRLLAYDALEGTFRTFQLNRDPACPACSIPKEQLVIVGVRPAVHASPAAGACGLTRHRPTIERAFRTRCSHPGSCPMSG